MSRRVTSPGFQTERDPEQFGRGVWASVILHVFLAVLLLASPALFPNFAEDPWGSESGGAGGIQVQLVANTSGVPLPAPAITSPDAAGNDSPGLYEPLPEPEPAAPDDALSDAEPVPETFSEPADREEAPEAEDPEPEPQIPPPPPRREPETVAAPPAPAPPPVTRPEDRAPAPDNAVPFGEGGQPSVSSGFALGGGRGGLDIGTGAFGEQHGTYVRSITQRISNAWVQSRIPANIRTAPRVYVAFDILRNGTIENIRVEQSSGNADIDRSAERAVFASHPLAPLPAQYRGTRVSVSFWFELTR